MATSNQFDVTALKDLDLPYDLATKELEDETPRIVGGNDLWITQSGVMRRRPVFTLGDFSGITAQANRVDRLWVVESLETPPKVYILASIYHAVNDDWEIYFVRLDAGTPPTAWTLMTNLRDLNDSTRAHELIKANGLAYIMGFPASGSSEKLGTVIFDPTDETTTFWGLLGPTVPAKVTSSGGWSASTNTFDIGFGWKYSYSYKTKLGQISNRSPLAFLAGETSNTGVFSDLKPEFTYAGHADTTNVPNIVIWRTTDGGGNLIKLDEITNPGSGSQTYVDDQRDTSTPGDPQTDFQLNADDFAPSLTSNSAPPRTVFPNVLGTDPPQPTTPLAFFANRIWYGIGNILYFSGQEEILNGIPFESFPSSTTGTRGNFFKLNDPIRNVIATNEALYVFTSRDVFWLRGFDRSSLQIRPLITDIGMPQGQPRARTALREVVAFLTQDNQIALLRGAEFESISFPLKNTIEDELNTSGETVSVSIVPHVTATNVLLSVIFSHQTTPANSKVFTYDLTRRKWNTPWSVPITAALSDIVRETDVKRQFVAALHEGSSFNVTEWDEVSNTDRLPVTAANTFAVDFQTNPFRVSAGNHLNVLREPAHHSVLAFLQVERKAFSGDADPTVAYRLDEISGSFTNVTGVDPPYVAQTTTIINKWFPVQLTCRRAALSVTKAAEDKSFEIQGLSFIFQPEAGS